MRHLRPALLLQDRAARVLQASAQLRQELGGAVQVMPPVSQSSMSQSINGRSSKTVTLLLPVVGPGGRTAQVRDGSPWLFGPSVCAARR